MVAFVGSEMAHVLKIYVEKDGENQTRCTDFDEDHYHAHEGCGLGTFVMRLLHWELWLRFVAIEHAVMCTRVLIMSVSPTNVRPIRCTARRPATSS